MTTVESKPDRRGRRVGPAEHGRGAARVGDVRRRARTGQALDDDAFSGRAFGGRGFSGRAFDEREPSGRPDPALGGRPDPALGGRPTRRERPARSGRPDRAYGATRGANALALDPEVVPESRPRTRATKSAVAAPLLGVAPPAPVSTPRAPFVAVILAVVIVGVLGILVINTKINENVFQLHDLRAQQLDLDRREQQLEQEIAQRESPGSLAAAARRLGLVRADTPAYLRLPDGRQLGMPRPAAGPASVSGQAAG